MPALTGDDAVPSENTALHSHRPAWVNVTGRINSSNELSPSLRLPFLKTTPFSNHWRWCCEGLCMYGLIYETACEPCKEYIKTECLPLILTDSVEFNTIVTKSIFISLERDADFCRHNNTNNCWSSKMIMWYELLLFECNDTKPP